MRPAEDPVLKSIQAMRKPRTIAREILRAWKDWSGKTPLGLSIRVCQIHYKPFERARVVAKARIEKPNSKGKFIDQFLLLQVYANSARARRRLQSSEKKRLLTCEGPPLFQVDHWHTVGWTLPNGPKLKFLSNFLSLESFHRFLIETSLLKPGSKPPRRVPILIRFVPRKRALLRYEGEKDTSYLPTLYIKLYSKGQDMPAARNLHLINNATVSSVLDFATPRMLVHSARCRSIVMEEIPGCTFTSLMENADSEDFSNVARALASLHRSQISTEACWTVVRELAILNTAMTDIKRILPSLTQRINALIVELEARVKQLSFKEEVPIHGNLFGDQILLDQGRVGIVDWDDLQSGDPLHDLGRLIAHFLFVARRKKLAKSAVARCTKALITNYEVRSAQRLSLHRLAWHVATALLMRAKISALRTLEPGWMKDIVTSLDKAWAVLKDPGDLVAHERACHIDQSA